MDKYLLRFVQRSGVINLKCQHRAALFSYLNNGLHVYGAVKTKKNPQAEACGLNPILGELEETGVTILRRIITVLFILVIRDIQYGNKAINIDLPGNTREGVLCRFIPVSTF